MRLTSLEQCSREKRRIVHDLILMYKFVFSLVDVQTSNFITPLNDAVPTRGNLYKVLLTVSRANVRRHFSLNELPLYGIVYHPLLSILEACHLSKRLFMMRVYLHGIDVLCFLK